MLRRVAVLLAAFCRARALRAVWLMYTHGLTAHPVWLGSDAAGWAVVPAGFLARVGSGGVGWLPVCFIGVGLPGVPPPLWCRRGVGRFNFPVPHGGLCGRAAAGGGWGLRHVHSVLRPVPCPGGGLLCRVCGGRPLLALVVLRVRLLVSVRWAAGFVFPR